MSPLTTSRCTVVGNSVSSNGGGGGIYSNLGALTLNECTVAGNAATIGAGAGGGIFNLSDGSPVTLNQCTVAGNSASTGGGFDSLNLGPGNVSTLALFNTILAENTAASDPDLPAATSPNQTGANLIGGNPLLAPLGNYGGPTPTMPPLVGSPAIDAVMSAPYNVATDQLGFPRRSGPHVDLGAVEVQPAPGAAVLTGLIQTGSGQRQFGFTNLAGASFTVFATTNAALPAGGWSNLGVALESPSGSGQFRFTDPQVMNVLQRFYRVRSP